jgi:hypothetical protein
VGLLTVDLRGGGGGGNAEMRSLISNGMIARKEVPPSEANIGSSAVLRMYINKAIDCYFEQAKPDGAENSGKPRVVHSGLEIALNGKKANILVLVFANVAQALEVARWMNLLDKGRPAFNIWPPGVRQAQTSETQLKVFKAY